jgi:hypothetical protein
MDDADLGYRRLNGSVRAAEEPMSLNAMIGVLPGAEVTEALPARLARKIDM